MSTDNDDYKYIYQMDWYSDKCSEPLFSCSYAKEEHTRWGYDWPRGVNYAEFCTVSVKRVLKNSVKHKMALHFSNLRDEGKDYTESTLKIHKKYIIINIDGFNMKDICILKTYDLTEEEENNIMKLNNTSTVLYKELTQEEKNEFKMDKLKYVNIDLEKFLWAIGFYGNIKDYKNLKSNSEIYKSFEDSVCIYLEYMIMDKTLIKNMIDKYSKDHFNCITITLSDEKNIVVF